MTGLVENFSILSLLEVRLRMPKAQPAFRKMVRGIRSGNKEIIQVRTML